MAGGGGAEAAPKCSAVEFPSPGPSEQRAPWLAGWLAHMQAPVTVPGPKEPCAPGEDQEAKEAEGRCWSRVTPLSPPCRQPGYQHPSL